MTGNAEIRMAVAADAEQIAALMAEWPSPHPRSRRAVPHDLPVEELALSVSHAMAAGWAEWIVAGWPACGYAEIQYGWSAWGKGRFLQVNELYVEESRRRQGIARALMRAALDHGQSQGIRRAQLSVNEHNRAAVALYESEGWLRSDPHDWDGGDWHDLRLWISDPREATGSVL